MFSNDVYVVNMEARISIAVVLAYALLEFALLSRDGSLPFLFVRLSFKNRTEDHEAQ